MKEALSVYAAEWRFEQSKDECYKVGTFYVAASDMTRAVSKGNYIVNSLGDGKQ